MMLGVHLRSGRGNVGEHASSSALLLGSSLGRSSAGWSGSGAGLSGLLGRRSRSLGGNSRPRRRGASSTALTRHLGCVRGVEGDIGSWRMVDG